MLYTQTHTLAHPHFVITNWRICKEQTPVALDSMVEQKGMMRARFYPSQAAPTYEKHHGVFVLFAEVVREGGRGRLRARVCVCVVV